MSCKHCKTPHECGVGDAYESFCQDNEYGFALGLFEAIGIVAVCLAIGFCFAWWLA